MHHRIAIVALSLFATTLAVGCEGGEAPEESEAEAPAEQEQAQEAEETETDGEARTITIEPVGNQMKYEQTQFTVKPGEKIRIVFNNTADAKAMKHNVVVLTTNDSETAMEVAQAGWGVPNQEYVPENDAILAHTAMSEPGETVEVTFEAPEEPGKYMYICTFPGHYPTMKGTMVVEG